MREGVNLIRMNFTQDFEKWAEGFSGCDGGNLHGSMWFCGIEPGTGKEHDLETELTEDVSEPPQRYQTPENLLRDSMTGRSHPFGQKLIKLITAIRGGSVADYLRVAHQKPFPFRFPV